MTHHLLTTLGWVALAATACSSPKTSSDTAAITAGSGSELGSGTCGPEGCATCETQIYGEQFNYIGDAVALTPGPITDVVAPLRYTASGLPPGLSIDPYSGTILGVVGPDANTDVPYTVTIDAKDSTLPRAWITEIAFTWWIGLSLDTALDRYNVHGDLVSIQLATPAGLVAPVEFVALGLPAGLTLDPGGAITGQIDAVPDLYPVTLDVVDSASHHRRYGFSWQVAAPPTLDQLSYVGEAVELALPLPDGSPPFELSATGLPPGLATDPFGVIVGRVALGAEAGSPYLVHISTTDSSGTSRSMSLIWTIEAWVFEPAPTTDAGVISDGGSDASAGSDAGSGAGSGLGSATTTVVISIP